MRASNRLLVIGIVAVAATALSGCCTCPGAAKCKPELTRYGSVILVKPECLEAYKEIHANCWPEVLAMIRRCNIRNYSIYYRDGYLFSYFEYVGEDFEADMAKMAADPKTQEWWTHTDPMQQPIDTAKEGEWWASMEEVFHTE